MSSLVASLSLLKFLLSWSYGAASHFFANSGERLSKLLNSIPSFEASGSVLIPLVCNQDKGTCAANQTEFESLFTSLQPVRDPTVVG